MIVKKKSILFKDQDQIKNTLLRHVFFTSYRSKGRRNFILLKTNRYIQVGLKKKTKKTKKALNYLLYKTLQFIFKINTSNFENKDYLSVVKVKKKRDDYSFNLKKKKSVIADFDLFYSNRLLNVKNFVPIFITKFEYNLYDRNYNLLRYFNYQKLKTTNYLYLQSYNFIIYNYLYFCNFYINIKNNFYINIKNALSNYNLYLNNINIKNIFNILKSTKFKYVKFGINNYIKFKNKLDVKHLKLLDKYLIRNKMFRTGKFFYHFLEYMKNFSYNVYKKNLLYRRYKYTKFDGHKHNTKLISFNVDRFKSLNGWFSIYNYIKKYSYLGYNENKYKVTSYFIKKCHFFYHFIIRFFYKIIKNLKFMFIEKFNFKKLNFFKIIVFYIFNKKWLQFKPLIRLMRKKKFKRWKIRRILQTRNLGYIRFLLRIKTRILNSRFSARLRLKRAIKKRKRLNFYKYKNTIRVVNWLLKLRKLKSIKNPFKKPFRRFRIMNNVDFKNKKLFKLDKINKFKQLSNNGKKVYNNNRKFVTNSLKKTNVRRF